MADILTPPDGGLLDTIPAGLYAVQVLPKGLTTETAEEDDWLFVQGIKKFDPKFDPQSEDDSDITMGGWKSEAGTSNGLTIDIEGLVKGTTAGSTFTPDEGMTELVDASKGIGDVDMVRTIRYWRTDGVEDNRQGRFLVKCSLTGGSPTELQKFAGQLIAKGKPAEIEKPIELGS